MAKVKLSLGNLNAEDLVAFANTVKTAMTGNASFPTPNPTLVAFGTLITTASTKIAAHNTAKAAAETALADRDAALAALRGSFSLLGDYVQNASGGDATKIEGAVVVGRAFFIRPSGLGFQGEPALRWISLASNRALREPVAGLD